MSAYLRNAIILKVHGTKEFPYPFKSFLKCDARDIRFYTIEHSCENHELRRLPFNIFGSNHWFGRQ